MFNFLKVIVAMAIVFVSVYLFARFSREYRKAERRYYVPAEQIAADVLQRKNVAESAGAEREDVRLAIGLPELERFLAEGDADKRSYLFREYVEGMEVAAIEPLFYGALALGSENAQAYDVARIALQQIAEKNAGLALGLLYEQAPYQKEKLAEAIANGWAKSDPLSAWDWVESAWMDEGGDFVDRSLQNQLSEAAMKVILSEHGDLAMAATLVGMTQQPDLKGKLVAAIASHIVLNDPEQALAQFEFEGDVAVDIAVMDAVMTQWAEQDLEGAVSWFLQNESEVSSGGIKSLAKQVSLNSDIQAVSDVRARIMDPSKQDVFVGEAARLSVRRDIVTAAQWLQSVGDGEAKVGATKAALYELGYEDFDSTVVLLDLVYDDVGGPSFSLMRDVYARWSEVDGERLGRYLNSGQIQDQDVEARLKAEFGL